MLIFRLLLLLALGLRACPSLRAEVASLLKEAAAAEERIDLGKALELYRAADSEKPNDAFILQKISKQLSDASDDLRDPAARRSKIMEALVYSKRAYELAPKQAVNVLSLAVCYGKLTSLVDAGTKVEYSRWVKRYAEEALALDPNYDWAHHVLGVWNYEVSQVGGPARAAARIFYGGLPSASCAEAVKHLEKAVELKPAVVSHHVELGYAYLSCGDRKRALEEFRTGLSLPAGEKHDENSKARARAGLARLGEPS